MLVKDIMTVQDAQLNRDKLNNFFDNLISANEAKKSIYVRFKWLAYLNRLMGLFGDGSVMFGLTLKALQVYTDKIFAKLEDTTPF